MKKQIKRISFEDKVFSMVNEAIEGLQVKSVRSVREIIKTVSLQTGYNEFSLAYVYGVA